MNKLELASGLPSAIQNKLAEFLMAAKTGKVELDIKDGRIVGWRLTESGRVDRSGRV